VGSDPTIVEPSVVVRVGRILFGLVACPGAACSADSATDDRARRSGHGATDHGSGRATGKTASSGASLVVAFGRLTGDCATDGADRATDHGARRPTHGHADAGSRQGSRTGADCLVAMLIVACVWIDVLIQGSILIARIVVRHQVLLRCPPRRSTRRSAADLRDRSDEGTVSTDIERPVA
jgi:hypothetical protein